MKWTGHWQTGKFINWKYVVELSKRTNINAKIIISPLFFSLSAIYLQKTMAQYIVFKAVLLYLLVRGKTNNIPDLPD